jgi:hypothetical protein
MCFSSVHSTILPILEETFANSYMKQNWEKNPDMKDIQGKFQPNFPNFENGKISKIPFLMINKFQWVTKHMEFFFGNSHIQYTATHGWSQLCLYHKIGSEKHC